jgi:hypothetical protein
MARQFISCEFQMQHTPLAGDSARPDIFASPISAAFFASFRAIRNAVRTVIGPALRLPARRWPSSPKALRRLHLPSASPDGQ